MEENFELFTALTGISQSGVNVAGLTDDKAYRQFLADMAQETPMKPRERRGFLETLRSHGKRFNNLLFTETELSV